MAVNSTGLATPAGPGTATVTATTEDQTARSGNIRLRVVQADLAAAGALGGDATGASAGNVVTILGCLAQVRAAAGSVSDPTDRALLAVALLYVDQIERRLGL